MVDTVAVHTEDLAKQEAKRRVLRACLELDLIQQEGNKWILTNEARQLARELERPNKIVPALGFGFRCACCGDREVATRVMPSGIRLCIRCENHQNSDRSSVSSADS